MKTFITRKLDLEGFIKKRPPTSIANFHIDYLKYILGLITSIPARAEHFDEHTGMVSINAKLLREKVRNYKQYLDYAVSTGILVTDNQYILGQKSKGYRYADKYLEKVVSVPIEKESLIRKEAKDRAIDDAVQKKYSYLTKWFNNELEIDHTGAIEFLSSTLMGDENIEKWNYNFYRIEIFKEHEFYVSVDGSVQRFHSNLTSMSGVLREFITYSGTELVAVDITNSQPFLSIALLNPSFYNNYSTSTTTIPFSIYSLYSSSPTPPPPLMLYKTLKETNNQDVKHFVELVTNGLIYEYLADEIKEELGIEFQTRKEVKEVMFTVLFTANRFLGQPEAGPKRVFKRRFPTVYEVFSLIKKEDKTLLPRLLQRVESFLVLDKICKRIAQERPYLPIFTIHDSVITTAGNEGYVEAIMKEELTSYIGYEPKLKTEFWRK